MMYNSLPYIFFLILYSNFLSLCPRAFEDFSNSICGAYWGSNVNANIEGNNRDSQSKYVESVFSARFIMLTCVAGEVKKGDECVSICGDGTQFTDGQCTSICGSGTEWDGTRCIAAMENEDSKSGGCLIATAAYGTELAPQIQTLREIRDNTLMETSSGTSFMAGFNTFYYTFSPAIADWERQSPAFASAVGAFLTPLISTLSIMNLAENTDSSVLALGISVIALNVGIYIGTPIGATYGVRKILKRSRA